MTGLAVVSHQAWQLAEALPLRACHHCKHRVQIAGADHCASALVAMPAATKPIAQARARHGGCGPDALHMAADWIDP